MAQFEKYHAKTLKGLEPLLAGELKALGAEKVELVNRGVTFYGRRALMYKVNLASRLALRVLVPFLEFDTNNPEGLYRKVRLFEWEQFLDNKMTFAIDSVVHSRYFTNSFFASQKVKDAIADRFRERTSLRPSVNRENPDLLINLHISERHATLSLDSSGGSLHKRGYRQGNFEAPLNEVLAAGMIMATGWRGDTPFLDPMCGSGTLAIEAALIAADIPPGIFKKKYGFETWKDFDPELLEHVAQSLPGEKEVKVPIIARDMDPEALRITKAQVKSMELSHLISIEELKFEDSDPMEGVTIVMNPPYGERMKSDDIGALYGMIGTTLKHKFPGSDAWILSSSGKAMKRVGLKPASKQILFNGPLECSFVNYKTFKGNWKEYKTGVKPNPDSAV